MATASDLLTRYSGQLHIDALLGEGPDWNYVTNLSDPNTLKYTFSVQWGVNLPFQPTTDPVLTSAQQTAVRQALAHAANVTGIRFVETSDPFAAQLAFGNVDLPAGTVALTSGGWSSSVAADGTLLSYSAAQTIQFDNVEARATFSNPAPGTAGYQILLHELGHALGLKHPNEGQYVLSTSDDHTENTLMSYNWVGAPKSVYQEYDVAAFNWLYGGDGLGGLAYGATAQGLMLVGTSGNDSLVGGNGNDTIGGLEGDDTLIGGAGNDALHGGPGVDLLDGGAGDDIYIVTAGDRIRDSAGIDIVGTEVSWTLGTGLEVLVLRGSASIRGTGNSLDNLLIGNDGANRLDGRGGADSMAGGLGNDTYVVSSGDEIADDGGIDTVVSAVSWTLDPEFEHLTLSGTAATDGAGNDLANRLRGNGAANRLDGGAGNDMLTGMGGNDTLSGGDGRDFFDFTVAPGATNADRILDFASGVDKIRLDDAVHAGIGLRGAFKAGDARFAANSTGTAQDASDRVIYKTSTGDLYYDADGSGDGGAPLLIATLGATLASTDIVII